MAGVWVKHGTTAAFLVALVDNTLDLKALSERLMLNVKSLRLGDFAVDCDAFGRSSDIDKIKAFASMADGGDGSKHSPFIIIGDPGRQPLDSVSSFLASSPFSEVDRIQDFVQQINVTCEDYGKTIEATLKRFPINGYAYKKLFPSSTVPICTLDGDRPCLLWEGVSEGRTVDKLWADPPPKLQITLLSAPSGSGKTRVLIDEACKQNCLFFVGKSGGFHSMLSQGSCDISYMARHLELIYPDVHLQVGLNNLECCIAIVVTARIYLRSLLRRIYPELKHRDWVFFQLEYPSRVRDVFRDLSSLLLPLVGKGDNSMLTLACKTVISSLTCGEGTWDGVVMVDEAQQMSCMLKDRFRALDDKTIKRPLLHSFLNGLANLGLGKSIFVAGTGESMLTIRKDILGSGTFKEFAFSELFRIPGFASVEDMTKYVQRFVDINKLDMPTIFNTLGGRRRFITSALENFILTPDSNTGTILDYVYTMCTRRGYELNVLHSLKDDVMRFLNRYKEGTLLRELALARELSGMPILVKCSNEMLELVNCNLGEFVLDNDAQLREVGMYIDTNSNTSYGWVRFTESLVARAILLNLKPSDRFTLNAQCSDLAIGTCYEPLTCLGLYGYFQNTQGRKLTELSELIMHVPAIHRQIYEEVCTLVKPKVPHVPLVQAVGPAYGLEHWMHDVVTGRASPFLHLGGDHLVRTDLIFLLQGANGKLYPCLTQVKSGKVDIHEAFQSVDINAMYSMARSVELEAALEELKTWCATGYLQLLVTTSEHDLQEKLCSYEDDLKHTNVNMPLRAVIDAHNIRFFGYDDLNSIMSIFKRTQEADKVMCQKKLASLLL